MGPRRQDFVTGEFTVAETSRSSQKDLLTSATG